MLKNRLYFKGMLVRTTVKIEMTEDELKQRFGNSKEDFISLEKYLLTSSVNTNTIARGQLAILSSYDSHGQTVAPQNGHPSFSYETMHYNCEYLKPDGTFDTMRWMLPEYLTTDFKLSEFNLSDEELRKIIDRAVGISSLNNLHWVLYIDRIR